MVWRTSGRREKKSVDFRLGWLVENRSVVEVLGAMFRVGIFKIQLER